MDNNFAIECLSSLAQPTRLDVFRLLVKQEPEGLPAGDGGGPTGRAKKPRQNASMSEAAAAGEKSR